jgi:hypothetical protein
MDLGMQRARGIRRELHIILVLVVPCWIECLQQALQASSIILEEVVGIIPGNEHMTEKSRCMQVLMFR